MSHSHQVKGEDLESLEREGVPGAGDEGVADISHPVHGEGEDEDVDDADFLQDPVRVEEEGNGDQGAGGDGETQQVDRSLQVLLQVKTGKKS